MRVTLFILSVVLFVSVAAAMTPVEIKRDYGDAVVTISTYSAAEDAVGLGSGFIVDPSGVIVTCHHVIDGAYPAVVKLLNGASFQDVWVLGCDSLKDVAVIRVKGRDLPSVKLGQGDDADVGERVVAIGNPKGLENTVSDGLLSGIREMDGFNLLQISAPISPGSSGGPVFNSQGQVVGIASATLTDGQNLNFCVPIRYATPLLACTSSVSLEEFSRGTRPSEVAASPNIPGGSRREFLRALIPMLKVFWEVESWLSHDKYRRYSEPVMQMAQLREASADILRVCSRLRAPNAELRHILERYTELAQQRYDAYDITFKAYSYKPIDEASAWSGIAKLERTNEEVASVDCMRTLTRDLACQYVLDAGIRMEELGPRLPSVFDSLPDIIVIGAQCALRELYPDAAVTTTLEAASRRVLGFGCLWNMPGMVVDSVLAGSQAQKAGLRRYDMITGAKDTLRFGNHWDYYMFTAAQPAGEPFVLNVLRDGRPLRLKVAFASQ